MTAADGTISLGRELRVNGRLSVSGSGSAQRWQARGDGVLHLDDAKLTGPVDLGTSGTPARGRLEGSGTVEVMTSVGAVVAPQGTIQAPSYTASSAVFANGRVTRSRLEIGATSATTFDRLIVTEAVLWEGPVLDVVLDPDYTPAPGDVLRFLQADGGLTGTFSAITGAGPFSVRYDATGAELYIPDTSGPAITPTVTGTLGDDDWYTSDVSLTWYVSEPDGEVTSSEGCAAQTVTEDTTGVTFTCSATSAGGTTTESVTIKRDATAPAVTVTLEPGAPDGDNGWWVAPVTVTYLCSDATSGVISCPETVTLGDGFHTSSVYVADAASNTGYGSAGDVPIDLGDPQVVCDVPAPSFLVGASGSVSATVTDRRSRPVMGTVSASASTSAPGSFTVALTGVDNAGRSTQVACPYTVSDATPPVVTPTVAPATPLSGWHTGDVSVTWAVSDPESAVTTTTGCGAATVATDGTTTVTCSATSSGGTTTQSVEVKRDATAPTISGAVAPASPAAGGWYVTGPTVTFSCGDATSGVASCSGPTTLGSATTPQSVSGTAVDVAGNTAVATVSGLKVDLVNPTVTCAAAPTFVVGQLGTVSATVTDGHSGPAAANVTAQASTATAGSFTAAVVGHDKAGRTTTAQCPYTVKKIPTTLDAHPVLVRLSPWLSISYPLSAVLRDMNGNPIAGQPVQFRTGGTLRCTATTSSRGVATCGSIVDYLAAVLNGGFTATYPGSGTYLSTSDSAGLLR
jgi:hypothetical protein